MADSRAAPLVALRHYRPQDFDATVRLWYEVGRAAHAYVSERFSYADYAAYFRDAMSLGCAIWLAEVAEQLTGFIILRGDFVDQLYVAVAHQRRGIGCTLMARARVHSPEGLWLRCFVRNTNARAFYERQGFRVVDFGVSEEGEPEMRYRWRPASVKRRPHCVLTGDDLGTTLGSQRTQ
jgi:ribosomal protein S18 acetylase RimI-like enzyme